MPPIPPRPSGRYAALAAVAVPSAVLVSVALVQMAMVYRSGLTPWKGGGFGMFSTVDMPASRVLKVHLMTDGGRIPAAPPEAFARDVTRVEAAPSAAALQALAERLAALTWVRPPVPDGEGPPAGPAEAVEPGRPIPPGAVRVRVSSVEAEVWRYTFDRADDRLVAGPVVGATAGDASRARPE